MVKDYCTDRHRAAFRDRQVQEAILVARTAVSDAVIAMAAHATRLDDALTLLDRYRRTPKPKPGTK
jgi:hypothetical protein